MPLPIKALCYGQLVFKSAGEMVPTSGHKVSKVEFVDAAGEIKQGFFKPLSVTYPQILAEYSVASCVFMSILDDRIAEERLVFNEKNVVIGSVSVAIPGFKPLLTWADPIPSDLQEKELVYPSVETLLQYNFAAYLIKHWISGEDDAHPGNVSCQGLIDGDMRLYHITFLMKGGRLSDGMFRQSPDKLMQLRGSDLDNFPNSLAGTHSPVRAIPANINAVKTYKNYAEFQKLAANPSLLSKDGVISFQGQLFNALLKELIIFDPELLRSRLEHYFGDIKFNYSCLNPYQRGELSKIYPNLFQAQFENKLTFVDHIMQVFYDRYQSLYRAVVFYPGCPNNASNVPVVAFNDYLRNKPSALQEILTQAEDKNKKMTQAWNLYNKKTPGNNDTEDFVCIESIATTESDTFLFKPEAWFNLEKIEKRYHQVWRDSLIFLIKDCLSEAKQLAGELFDELRIKPIALPQAEKTTLSIEDANFTKAVQLLEDNDFEIEVTYTDCDRNNSILLGLQDLEKFRKSLKSAALNYYDLEVNELSVEKNQLFRQNIFQAIFAHENTILKHLSNTQWAGKFCLLMAKITNFYVNFNFQQHLNTPDSPIETKAKHNYAELLKIPHTDPKVMYEAIKALFDWANKLDRDTFNGSILAIIREHYKSSPLNILANRHREESVTNHLKTSIEDNANKLAFILSTGGDTSTSLNTKLIEHLMKLFVSKTIDAYTVNSIENKTLGAIDVNLISVEYACDRNTFQANIYTTHAIKYARQDSRFSHIYSKYSLTLFNNWMYNWVNSLDRFTFLKMINKSLKLYEPYCLNYFSSKGRAGPIRLIVNNKYHSHAWMLASIFLEGKINESSFNTILFRLILEQIPSFLSTNKEMQPAERVALKVSLDKEHMSYYLQFLAEYAKNQTYAQHLAITYNTEPARAYF